MKDFKKRGIKNEKFLNLFFNHFIPIHWYLFIVGCCPAQGGLK